MDQGKQKLEAYRHSYHDKYVPLGEIVPLQAPLSVLIDPANICNFRCIFCPTGHRQLLRSVNRPEGIMRFDLFKKIINDMVGFPQKIKVLNLYKDGEPLLNKDLVKMVAYAKEMKVADSIQTTTNAAHLSKGMAQDLIQSGLDKIRISIAHVTNDGYKRLTKATIAYEKLRQDIQYLYAEKIRRSSPLSIHVKILDTGLTEEEKSIFLKDFDGACDTINIDSLMGWSHAAEKEFTLGTLPERSMVNTTKLAKDRVVCPEPFKSMAINFNGQVSACCVDWAMSAITGNVNTENLVDTWNGTTLNEFRCIHLQGRRGTIPACADCHYVLGHAAISDLDGYRDRLIKEYSHSEGAR